MSLLLQELLSLCPEDAVPRTQESRALEEKYHERVWFYHSVWWWTVPTRSNLPFNLDSCTREERLCNFKIGLKLILFPNRFESERAYVRGCLPLSRSTLSLETASVTH